MASLAGAENDDYGQASSSEPLSKASSQKETSEIQTLGRRSIWLDTWLFESLTLGFSIACFIALCGVLRAYDNKVRPQMAYSLSLNTIVSVLATGCKSSLILAIGEAISQLKWLWFQDTRRRQLFDLQTFDAASRGPLGSLMILIHHRGRSLVSLGAVVVILLLAFDPFMQQVLSYPVRKTDSNDIGGAVAPQLREFIPTSVTLDWWTAFAQGIWSNESVILQPTCSSDSCTWKEFSSVGICSRCADMTTVATLKCSLPNLTVSFNRTCQIILPHGDASNFTIVYDDDDGSLSLPARMIWQPFQFDIWSGKSGPNTTFAGVDHPLLTYAYAEIGFNHHSLSPGSRVSDRIFIKNVTDCTLSVCLRDFNVSVTNGHTSIQTLKIDFGTYWNQTEKPYTADKIACWRPGRPHAGDQAMTEFSFCNGNLWVVTDYAQPLFPAVEQFGWAFNSTLDGWIGPYVSPNDFDGHLHYGHPNLGRIANVGFEKIITNVAASLTKLGLEKTNYSVNGTVHITEVFVSVQWPWLALPALLVLIGTIFVIATIAVNRRSNAPLWKSSALAPLYHGLERFEKDEYMTASIMEKAAERVVVQLQYSAHNGRLMLRWQELPDACQGPLPRGILEDKTPRQEQNLGQRQRTALTI
ncbi:hypothetical protein N7474_005078 [Penicillium riverlandense]|uniref:uncharacterized protein n=1 Tax=Penicillium riverlandense TaxID=1903569 RepID=UPI002547915B|nr:uncharacterized protein N7474_005078 [Penicillium riverlandense]KAJ5819487.1 hypothetical protein N7474_005078 [Penicillium riverlandense]